MAFSASYNSAPPEAQTATQTGAQSAQPNTHPETPPAPHSGLRPQTAVPTAFPADSLTIDSLVVDTMHIKQAEYTYTEPWDVYGTADSVLIGPLKIGDPLYHEAAPEDVFGTASVQAMPPEHVAIHREPLTDNGFFQGLVLLLAAVYALLVYHNINDVRQLLQRISHAAATRERFSEDPRHSGFSRFLNIVTAIGMLFLGVVSVKFGGDNLPASLLESSAHWVVPAMTLLAAIACTVIVLYQIAVLRLAGAILLEQPFIAQLIQLKRSYFSLSVILLAPALLLYALCPQGTGNVWAYVLVIGLLITAILYLKEALFLFISKKVSILHWFLYLCAVEILPVSFLWLLAVR